MAIVEVEVVVAHSERATLRVGYVFLKIDAEQRRTDVEVELMARAPIPTPEVLWQHSRAGRSPRDGLGAPGPAIDRLRGRMGRGRCRSPQAARGAVAGAERSQR